MIEVFIGLVLLPIIYILGYPVLRMGYGRAYRAAHGAADQFLHGICVLLGIAEAVHVAAIVLSLSVTVMAGLLALAVGAVGAISLAAYLAENRKKAKNVQTASARKPVKTEKICLAIFLVSLILQIIVIFGGSYRGGDMTPETVQTFLAENAMYTHNPLTGQPYTAGIPMRLKILCLPGFYAALCSLTGADVSGLVGVMIPVLVLLAGYTAYYRLGQAIFGEKRTMVAVMLLIVSLLFWCGGYLVSMDGFLLLHCGYRGVAIRNGVLIPFVLSMCLEKKYRSAFLGILAEACIVWTLYGFGSCALVTGVMYLLHRICSRGKEKRCRN